MNPILRIITYLFKQNNLINTNDTYDSFFDDGASFPQLIEILFNEKIPQILSNPMDAFQKKSNNDKALQFLFEKNSDIANISPSYITEKDKESLLALILTKQCYKINTSEIISKCNLIVRQLHIQFKSEIDLLDTKCILSLLNVLTKGKVHIDDKNDDFDIIMKNCFEIAKVPLVIDKTSIEPQYRFTFFIQILIIFDFFSDEIRQIEKSTKKEEVYDDIDIMSLIDQELQIDSHESDTKSKKKKEISAIQIEKMNDEILLKTINFICSTENIKFQSITYAIDNVIQFAKIFFKDQEDATFLSNLSNKIMLKSEKINDLVLFLAHKEPIFQTYLFNFTDKKLKITSTSLFFTKFLDHFFIRRSKQEVIEKIKILLFTTIDEKDTLYNLYSTVQENENSILFNWDVYLALVYFINKGSVHFKKEKAANDDFSFKTKNIPQIIDEDYLNLFVEDSSLIYYQLQFIFDKMNFQHVFVESCLTTLKKIKKINVPKYDKLKERIVSKNISLILQNKRYKEFCKTYKNTVPLNETKSVEAEPKEEEFPETFNERQSTKQLKINDTNEQEKSSSFVLKSSEEYWNQDEEKYSFDDGILFLSKNKNLDLWNNSINEYNKSVKQIHMKHEKISKAKVFFDEIPPQGIKSKLYKFFYYNEKKMKWEKNATIINQFFKEMYIEQLNIKVPLVLFLNSDEKELIELNSKMIQFLYPDIDELNDDQIFVYALCGKALSLLNYKVDMSNHDCSIKPVFLLLHVPKNKMKLNNIKTIVYQIYFFLSIICDIKIVVLNQEYYIDQIEMLENLNEIRKSIEISADKRINLRSQLSASSQTDLIDDSDSIDDLGGEEEEENNDDIFSRMDLQIFKKKLNYIILINSQLINSNDNKKTIENQLFISIKKHIDENNFHLSFINVKKSITYRDFLMKFNEISMNYLNNYEEAFEKFDYYEMAHISGIYFMLKRSDKLKSKLEIIVRDRFNQLKESGANNLSDFDHLAHLHKEIIETYPSIDDDYYNECNKILSNISKEIAIKNKNILHDELEESSKNNLIYLKNIIFNQAFWSETEKSNIKINHTNFLKNEFFNTIKILYPSKNRSIIFQSCYYIIENQIDEDRRIIDKFFGFVENKQVVNIDIVDISDKRKKGTNYMVRERENVHELEVIVDAGNLEKTISQDF